ncbi:MAG: DMT family transporter [Plectolyngbya sp. WJT66-NPBG17]|jgi:drug/metabolite transporter (DMT)-like permease|nr:DMT family transporter [Plectolyngbya sp. WJT66-NPBG17]
MTYSRFPKLAVLALIAIALLWGYSWTQMKIGVQYSSPFAFAALRNAGASLVLLSALIVRKQSLKPKEVSQTFLLGLLQTSGFSGFAAWALVSGGAGKTSILVYTMPFWTLLLAWYFLGERIKGVQWIAIAVAFSGLLLILDPFRLQGSLFSGLLAVLAGLSWAGGTIAAKKVDRSKVDLLSLTTWQTVFGALPLIAIAFLLPAAPIQWNSAFIGALAYSVLPGNAIPMLLWMYVLSQLPAGLSGLGMLMTPVLGVTFAALQLGEYPQVNELIGIGCVLSALVLTSIANRK